MPSILEYLAHCQYFGNMNREEYVPRVLTAVSLSFVQRVLPVLYVFGVSILRVHICLCPRGFVLLILPVLSVIGPSQRSLYFGRQYSNTLSTRTTNCSRASTVSVKPLFYPERQEIPGIYFARPCFVCAGFYSADHKVLPGMSQPRPHATFGTYVYTASNGLIAASHLFRINIHLPVPSFREERGRSSHHRHTVACIFLDYFVVFSLSMTAITPRQSTFEP